MPIVTTKPALEVYYSLWEHPTFRWWIGRDSQTSEVLQDARQEARRLGYLGIRLLPIDKRLPVEAAT